MRGEACTDDSQRWHRSLRCTLTLSLTLSVHRKKKFKSSYAELCRKGENTLLKEFVEMLLFLSKVRNALCNSKYVVNLLLFAASLKSWPSFGSEL